MATLLEVFTEARDADRASARREGLLEGQARTIVRFVTQRFGADTARRLSRLLTGVTDLVNSGSSSAHESKLPSGWSAHVVFTPFSTSNPTTFRVFRLNSTPTRYTSPPPPRYIAAYPFSRSCAIAVPSGSISTTLNSNR